MDIIKLAYDALVPVADDGIPVQQGWYDESIHDTHITLWNLDEYPQGHSDDGVELVGGDVQVTIFSPRDEVALAKRVRKLMVATGFTWTGGDQDDMHNDGGIYMKPQRFHYDEEEEE